MSRNVKVLVVDDEVAFCYFVKENLSHHSMFDVAIATNGKEAIGLAKSEQPDMPGEDVADALQKYPDTADIPILFITALATNDDITDTKEGKIGNNYMLPKPVRTKKLIETILNILERDSPL